MNGKPRRTRARIESANKAKRAAELYAEGKTWREIADELGVRSQAGVRQLVERHIEALPRVAVGVVREVLLERLTRAHETALKLLDDRDKAVRLRAADVVARVAERIAKMHGLERLELQHAMLPATTQSSFDSATLEPAELLLVHAVQQRASGETAPAQLVEAARRLVAEHDARALAAKQAAMPAVALLPEHQPIFDATIIDDDPPVELS